MARSAGGKVSTYQGVAADYTTNLQADWRHEPLLPGARSQVTEGRPGAKPHTDTAMKTVLFALRWSALGLLAAALVVLALRPPGLHGKNALVRLLSAPAPGYADAVMRAAPAVVSIDAVRRDSAAGNPLTSDPLFRRFFADDNNATDSAGARRTTNLGSGVILAADGVVLTNYHVIRGSEAVGVVLEDGRRAAATVLGTDPDTDLAVLRIVLDDLPAIPIAAADEIRVGDIVLAIGNALGIGQTVTQGIVSATGRNRIGINTFENFIQTDAAINFGNSGGALVNHRGELVGINAARIESEGIGFAIPAGIALAVAREIVSTGSVARGWLGIDARDLGVSLQRELGIADGITVLGVMPGGPADSAGIRAGDVYTHIGDAAIVDSHSARELIAARAPGTQVELRGLRDGQPFSLPVTVSRRPPPADRAP